MIKYITLTDVGKAKIAQELTELLAVLYEVTQQPKYADLPNIKFDKVQVHLSLDGTKILYNKDLAQDSLSGPLYVIRELDHEAVEVELTPMLCFPVLTGDGFHAVGSPGLVLDLRKTLGEWINAKRKTSCLSHYYRPDATGWSTSRHFIDATTGTEANLDDWCVIVVGLWAALTPDMYTVVR